MTAQEFNHILEHRLCKIRDVLASKANEYASDDILHNFKSGIGEIVTNESPALVCWGYMRKHLQSVYDIASGLKPATPAAVDEKIGDAINYMILLEAILLEQQSEESQKDSQSRAHHGAD